MSKKRLSGMQFGDGLMPVESVADIPLALVEVEAECSSLQKELELVARSQPENQAVMSVLANRAAVMLKQVSACRQQMMQA